MHLLLHFLCSGFEYKESKMEKRAYCGLDAKIPGAGGGFWRRTAPALRGSCMDLDLHHLTGSFCLRRGCVASRGGFPVVRGTGRPAGSRYLRLGGVPPEGFPLLGEGASRSGYFVFCEMPVMRLMTKSCCSSVTMLSQ